MDIKDWFCFTISIDKPENCFFIILIIHIVIPQFQTYLRGWLKGCFLKGNFKETILVSKNTVHSRQAAVYLLVAGKSAIFLIVLFNILQKYRKKGLVILFLSRNSGFLTKHNNYIRIKRDILVKSIDKCMKIPFVVRFYRHMKYLDITVIDNRRKSYSLMDWIYP